jgi:hypothetical protein
MLPPPPRSRSEDERRPTQLPRRPFHSGSHRGSTSQETLAQGPGGVTSSNDENSGNGSSEGGALSPGETTLGGGRLFMRRGRSEEPRLSSNNLAAPAAAAARRPVLPPKLQERSERFRLTLRRSSLEHQARYRLSAPTTLNYHKAVGVCCFSITCILTVAFARCRAADPGAG